jgi:rSAM/selenodomain-associated transferase 1
LNTVGLFAKYWQAGKVKTRLAKSIGNDAAAKVHWECLSFLIRDLNQVGDRRIIVFSPSENSSDFAELAGSDWDIQPQASGDLGWRMQTFFQDSFHAGAQRVLVMGADCPALNAKLIANTWELLQTNDAVIGPSADGGYYLLGLRQNTPALFGDMPWSSQFVLPTTLDRLQQQQLSYSLLPTLTDIDDLDSLNHVLNNLHDGRPTASVQKLILQLQKYSQSN